jgi:hypothetical protein
MIYGHKNPKEILSNPLLNFGYCILGIYKISQKKYTKFYTKALYL